MEICSICGEEYDDHFELSPNNPVCDYCQSEIEDDLSITWMIDENPDDFYEHEYDPYNTLKGDI